MGNKIKKVPIMMQMEALECGAASLGMILAYHKKWLPLETLRVDCGVSRDGSNAKNIAKAAIKYGLAVKAYRYTGNDLKEGKVTFPCIIHWNYSHFLVVKGIKGDKVHLADPARGAVTIPFKDFDAGFTGIVLTFEKTDKFEASGEQKSILEFAKKRLKNAKSSIILAVVVSLITALIGVISPIFDKVFYDRLILGDNTEWITPFLVIYALFTIFTLIINYVQDYTINLKIQGKFAISANAEYLWHVLRLPMQFFSQRQSGDLSSRQSENEQIAYTMINQLAPTALNFIMMIFYFFIMIQYSILLTVIGVASLVINMLVAQIISQKRINVSRVASRDAGKLNSVKIGAIEMIESIKASGAENGYFQKFSGLHASVNSQKIKLFKINQYLGNIPTLVNELTSTVILMTGAFLIIQGEFTVGSLIAFQGFLASFSLPVNSFISLSQDIQEMRVSMERIEDVFDYPADVLYDEVDTGEVYEKLTGNIEIKNITFGYSKLAEPLIENFSLSVKSGQKIALVGSSGCGKSTISKLLSGLYEPDSGEIKYDGKSIREIKHEVFVGSLAVVDQDIVLFNDSISDNLKMWDNTIEDFEIILAARDVKMHDKIVSREGGYNHMALENGKNFSGGERQRLEIARVLAQDPTIIILDEATSALDAKTEYEVVKSIKNRGITSIVVAHRLSTIRDADEIIVLDKGKIVERGTHQELYKNGGAYFELVSNE